MMHFQHSKNKFDTKFSNQMNFTIARMVKLKFGAIEL
jgi:hypothetical protein